MSIPTTPSVSEFLNSSGAPSAFGKGDPIGKTVRGIVEAADVAQQIDFDTQKPKFYEDSGKPMMQLIVTLATDERDPATEDDDGRRRLYVKGAMLQAIRDAIRKAVGPGKPLDVEIGAKLAVQYTGDGEPTRKGLNPPKQFKAQYETPAPRVSTDDLL